MPEKVWLARCMGVRHPVQVGLIFARFSWHVDGCVAQLVLGFPFIPFFNLEDCHMSMDFLPYVFGIMPLSIMPLVILHPPH